MSSLTERLLARSTIKMTAVFNESKLFAGTEAVPTRVPLLNVALGGSIDGGLQSGLGVMAGPSKHFKTSFTLLMVAAYLDKYKDAVCLFYDSEFGAPQSYFKAFGIDPSRVIHTPINNIEELKFDVIQQLEEIQRKDKVIIIIDSIGNLASKKEVEDAKNEKSVADMTRAKQLKSLFRMVTPFLTTKDIPMIAINHTYQTQEMYSKAVVSGGCLEAGTLIQTPAGLKAIELFQPGDTVLTMMGEKTVTHVWDPETLHEGTPECYEVGFEDGHTVVCSAGHKFLIGGAWVEAKDLVVGQEVTEYAE